MPPRRIRSLATIGARLRLATGDAHATAQPRVIRDVQGRERLETTPRLARSPMAPHAWLGRWPRPRASDAMDGQRRGSTRRRDGKRDPGDVAHPRIAATTACLPR